LLVACAAFVFIVLFGVLLVRRHPDGPPDAVWWNGMDADVFEAPDDHEPLPFDMWIITGGPHAERDQADTEFRPIEEFSLADRRGEFSVLRRLRRLLGVGSPIAFTTFVVDWNTPAAGSGTQRWRFRKMQLQPGEAGQAGEPVTPPATTISPR